METAQTKRKTGRPLSFDPEAALVPAMLLFWRHGYEATSLAELTRAMGVTAPSVYAAYGDKKGLFRAVVKRYSAQPQSAIELIEQAPSAMAAARILMEGAAIAFTGADTPPGCLLASSAIAVSAEADDVRSELAAIRHAIEAALRDKITADLNKSHATTSPAVLAAYVLTVIQGLSTMARDGAPRTKLLQVTQLAMTVWPASDAVIS